MLLHAFLNVAREKSEEPGKTDYASDVVGGTGLTWFHLNYVCSNKSVPPATSFHEFYIVPDSPFFVCNVEKLRGALV